MGNPQYSGLMELLVSMVFTTWEDRCKSERLNKKIRRRCQCESDAICQFGPGHKYKKFNVLIQVLMLVGPWLTTWEDWRKIERLNKAIYEWCHSEEAAICLFELWQERTMSLSEMRRLQNSNTDFLAREKCFENPIPFLGHLSVRRGCSSNKHGKEVMDDAETKGNLYRSLLNLYEIEEEILGNAHGKDSQVINGDPLPLFGVNQWLIIDFDTFNDSHSNCIPPYYHLRFAVPKGLNIVVHIGSPSPHHPKYLEDWIAETCEAVGRAAALGLNGLLTYDYCHQRVVLQILESFVRALEEENEGMFESPLEILSISIAKGCNGIGSRRHMGFSEDLCRLLPRLEQQFVHGKLRNLKYLSIGCKRAENVSNNFSCLTKVPCVCPNLQVLELVWHSTSNHAVNTQWPGNVCGPQNCILSKDVVLCDVNKDIGNIAAIYLHDNEPNPTSCCVGKSSTHFLEGVKYDFFRSLRVLVCTSEQQCQNEMLHALVHGCPNLQSLQIQASSLLKIQRSEWYALVKRLFVLILGDVIKLSDPVNPHTRLFNTKVGIFPEGCELRALIMVCDDVDEEGSFHLLSWLEGLLDIKDVHLPKLAYLNVIFRDANDTSLTEVKPQGILKDRFRKKSVDLRFLCADNDVQHIVEYKACL